MIITKTIAEAVSVKMVSKKVKENEKLLTDFKEMVYRKIIAETDVKVLQFQKDFPNYCKTSRTVSIIGNGFNHRNFNLSDSFPNTQDGYSKAINPTVDEGTVWQKKINEYDSQKEANELLKREIYNALLALKTYKKIETEFPQAFKYLPKNHQTALTVDLSGIIKKLG